MPVSVVLVSYNTCAHLRRCLESLLAQTDDIIVIDNASKDESPEMVAREFPSVQLIANAHNVGFGAANNQGLALAKHQLVLLLNSDTVAEAGAIAELERHFGPEIAALGGALLNSNGAVQPSCCNALTAWAVFCEQSLLMKLFPASRLFNPYWITHRLPPSTPSEVEQVMGACLLVRNDARFDESFFLYCEDTELCHRLRKTGRILYIPTARFQHALGASTEGNRAWAIGMYNAGKVLYFQIHRPTQAELVRWLNWGGAFLRETGYRIARKPEKAAMFKQVRDWHSAVPPLPLDARDA